MDDPSKVLNTCKVGCLAGSQRVNHLMYADNLVLLSPSSKGLPELLQWCQCYGIQADIRYNCKKSVVMICNPTKDKPGHEPNFVWWCVTSEEQGKIPRPHHQWHSYRWWGYGPAKKITVCARKHNKQEIYYVFAYSEDDALQDLLYLDVHGAYMVLLQEGYHAESDCCL